MYVWKWLCQIQWHLFKRDRLLHIGSQTLSSIEAKHVVLSKICCEILFVKMILEFLGKEIEYSIIVHCDNVGAIHLAYNIKISNRTKHVDTRTHVRHYVEDGTIEITSYLKITMQTSLQKIPPNLYMTSIQVNSWLWIQLSKGGDVKM